MESERIASLSRSIDKIALELVFAQAGQDQGLLPINSLLSELSDASDAAETLCLKPAIAVGQAIIDGVFLRDGVFNKDDLAQLADWAAWMQHALPELSAGRALPPLPSANANTSATASATTHAAPAHPPGVDEDLILNLENDAELLQEFVTESREHLQNIETGVLELDQRGADADILNSVFRAFHTFKGGSGFLNLKPINRLAHELESLLDLARQGKLVINGETANLVLAGGDTLRQFVDAIQAQLASGSASPIRIPIGTLLESVSRIIEPIVTGRPAPAAPVVAQTPAAVVAQPVSPSPEPVAEAKVVPLPGASEAVASKQPAAQATVADATVKIATGKLDSLLDLVGELVVAQSLVKQGFESPDADRGALLRHVTQLNRITKELQTNALSLRMVPIRATFQKMSRLVRDLAAKANKQVELTFTGEETELDRGLVEELSDPLVHMIRNSVDHGIEKSEVRTAAGKSPKGRIHLHACHRAGNVVVEISDDGGGLNQQRILNKAIERGLVPAGAILTEKQIFDLIFEPGFSTADKITDISGRGVGMDVVRRNVTRLRGKIDISSKLGSGSKFTIQLPLTLAIIDGLIAGVGEQRFVFPTLSVRESFRPSPEMLSTIQQRGEVLDVRGRLVPLLRLWQFFSLQPRATCISEGIVVVVECNDQFRAVLVDDLIGKQEVVIKSLDEVFKKNRTLAGAAILGDGRLGLILDPSSLVKIEPLPDAEAA
jgi:two-component system, chemotaxis family, sensor kinase CheA